MRFTKWPVLGESPVLKAGRRQERSRLRRGSPTTLDRTRVARAFYCDVLQGRQVWEAERAGGLSFIVEGTRIDVGASPASDREPVVLPVLDPSAVAERCWDAGYSVRVPEGEDSTAGAAVSVIDPFGRRIDLVR